MPRADAGSPPDAAGQAPRRAGFGRLGCSLLVGTLAGLAVTLAVLRWQWADPTPQLTRQSFDAAQQRWRAHGPADYDIEVHVTGPQPGRYRVSVRGGQSVAAYRNDRPLTQRRVFSTWSVPGMFGTISRDVENVERRRAGRADLLTGELTLRASFHPHYGYPQHYLRMESGSVQDVSWDVVRFDIVTPEDPGG